MHYIIDGYNLLFQIEEKIDPLQESREEVISFLLTSVAANCKTVTVVFDSGKGAEDFFPTRYSLSNLEVIYSPKNLCADKYILEMLQISTNPKRITVISSDNFLCKRGKELGAKALPIDAFLEMIFQRKRKREATFSKPNVDSEKNLDRLHKIFSMRLKNQDLDDF